MEFWIGTIKTDNFKMKVSFVDLHLLGKKKIVQLQLLRLTVNAYLPGLKGSRNFQLLQN